MSKQGRQSGFTLIEIMLVLAISSLLTGIAIAGFSSWRMSVQFSDSMDFMKESMNELRQESLANINTQAQAGEDPNQINFGRIITFTPGSSTVQVDQLRTANTDNPPNNQVVEIVSTENREIKWGVVYDGAQSMSVAFTQSLTTGKLQTTYRSNWNLGNLRYSDFAPSTGTVSLQFRDPANRLGRVTIDPLSGGITRSIP